MTDVGEPLGPMRVEPLPLRTYGAVVAALLLVVGLGSWGAVAVLRSSSTCDAASPELVTFVTDQIVASPDAVLVDARQVDAGLGRYLAAWVVLPGAEPIGPAAWLVISPQSAALRGSGPVLQPENEVALQLTPPPLVRGQDGTTAVQVWGGTPGELAQEALGCAFEAHTA